MTTPADHEVLNMVVRMVVPMRREFARQLDVRQFLHDLEYARDVIEQAMTSQDPRLQHYAAYMLSHHLGPRNASHAASAAADAVTAPVAAQEIVATEATPVQAVAAPGKTGSSAEELRQRVMKKYTTGLR